MQLDDNAHDVNARKWCGCMDAKDAPIILGSYRSCSLRLHPFLFMLINASAYVMQNACFRMDDEDVMICNMHAPVYFFHTKLPHSNFSF